MRSGINVKKGWMDRRIIPLPLFFLSAQFPPKFSAKFFLASVPHAFIYSFFVPFIVFFSSFFNCFPFWMGGNDRHAFYVEKLCKFFGYFQVEIFLI
jgi:hypothetical protein